MPEITREQLESRLADLLKQRLQLEARIDEVKSWLDLLDG